MKRNLTVVGTVAEIFAFDGPFDVSATVVRVGVVVIVLILEEA